MEDTISEKTEAWLSCLQQNGYRRTIPRQAVVQALVNSCCVLNPLDIYELARGFYPKLGLVTVYRTIEKLEELGLLQRVHQPSGCQGFVAAASGRQCLLICQECGRVDFFDDRHEGIDSLITDVAQKSGYCIQEHWLQLFGICARCQQST